MTELVLGVVLSGIIVWSGFNDDYDHVLLGVVCLALLGFEVLNKRWGGSVR